MIPLNRYYMTLEQVDKAATSMEPIPESVKLLKQLAETDTTLKEFLTRLRFKFATDTVLYYDYYGDEDGDMSHLDPSDVKLNAITSFSNKFYIWIKDTNEYYGSLINLQVKNLQALLDGTGDAELETSARFNDTPQEGGDFDDDIHASNVNYSKTTQKADLRSKVAQTQSLIKDYYGRWLNQFSREFIRYPIELDA